MVFGYTYLLLELASNNIKCIILINLNQPVNKSNIYAQQRLNEIIGVLESGIRHKI